MFKIYLFVKKIVARILPKSWYRILMLPLHYKFALIGALYFGLPSRNLTVIGVTGTNGKSTVVEMLHEILAEAGIAVASASSIRTNINGERKDNLKKMTMGGRMFVQRFLAQALKEGSEVVILEVTSEGIKQFRHKFINFDIAVLTNITPEHIESHGSFEKYKRTKMKLFKIAHKHVLNGDDDSFEEFKRISAEERRVYRASDIEKEGIELILPGKFNKMNALAVLRTAQLLHVKDEVTKAALKKIGRIPGRFEVLNDNPKIVVDYAHTPDALQKVYEAAREQSDGKLICVLGSTGGGRDKWKRAKHGAIASQMCDRVIFTNEDPYDEDPEQIIKEVANGAEGEYEIILDRGDAIEAAVNSAELKDIVVITGKGSEGVMAVKAGELIPWDDRKEVRRVLAQSSKS